MEKKILFSQGLLCGPLEYAYVSDEWVFPKSGILSNAKDIFLQFFIAYANPQSDLRGPKVAVCENKGRVCGLTV